MRRGAAVLLALVALWGAQPPAPPAFRNIAAAAGLRHPVPNGGTDHKQFILETTGSGVGWLDYDNDGLLDAVVVSGDGAPTRLYRNQGKGKLQDVSPAMGLTRVGWGQGVCAGDFDNDGYTDLLVTYWGQNSLYRNVRGQRFADVTQQAGLRQDRVRYNTGCAFLDYDRDGDLDVVIANYVRFDPATTPKPGANPYCWYRNVPVNCGPRGLPFDRQLLYRNNGDGTFTDVSLPSGVGQPAQHYGLGVLTGDFNGDGWPDFFIACDQTPSLLFINQRDGTFAEEALLRGAALDESGKALSGMGATAADYDGSGWLSIFRTNFSDERETLYRNRGQGEFDDVTTGAGMAHNTRYVGWGCGFFDFDHDGWKDLLLVNGHVFPEVDQLPGDVRFRERAILYRNLGQGKFADVSERAGPALQERHSARGAAFGDLDNDGALEVLINQQNELPSLWQQSPAPAGHWLLLQLRGTRSNRSAIGTQVRLTVNGHTQLDEVRSGGSYLSQNDLRLHFGLGAARRADVVEIRWPNGRRQILQDIGADRILTLDEP